MKKLLTIAGLVSVLGVGSAFATASVSTVSVGAPAGTATYGTAASVTYTVTISASGSGATTVTPSVSSVLPSGVSASFSPTTVTLNNGNSYSASTVLTLTTTSAASAGTTAFTVSNDKNAVTGSGSVTIGTRPVTVTADAKSKNVGDSDPALTYQITSGSLANSDSFSGSLSRDAGETAGTYAINQGTLALSSNYVLSYVGASFTINAAPILDTTAPVITLVGVTPVNLTVGDSYTDAGATALDDTDGDITANITSTTTPSAVDTSVPGTFTVHYNVSDAAGNPATEVTRTVNVSAAPVTSHTVSASAGSNGSISPTGSVSVNVGADQSFTITADSGYHIDDVTVDSVSVGATSTYLFSAVSADHTIAATFAADVILPTVEACNGSTFDSFSLGTVNGQGGWVISGSYDQAVAENIYGFATLGCKVLRISDSVTSGSFGDQLFSPSTTDEAGETDALNDGMSGGSRKSHFEAEFDLASAMSTEQTGMHMSVSPDRGDGARMSYLRFEDSANGINVFFDDVQGTVANGVDGCTSSACGNFVETQIATELSRSTPHTIKFVMDFVNGPSNDIVKIYIDGALVHTGTSWEDYYRFDPESNPSLISNSRTVDSLLFRQSGTSHPANAGEGYLLDNVFFTTNNTPLITLNGEASPWIAQGDDYTDPMATASDATDGTLTVSSDRTLTTDTVGTYTITYTATSSDNIASSVSRTVHIYARVGGAGGTNGVPGCTDPAATNYDSTAVYPGFCSYPQVLGAATSTDGTPVGALTSTSTPGSNGGKGQVLGATAYGFVRNLGYGALGTDVIELQKMLIAEGFLKLSAPTNYFGGLTKAALVKWQKAHGITPASGFFGPISRKFLTQ